MFTKISCRKAPKILVEDLAVVAPFAVFRCQKHVEDILRVHDAASTKCHNRVLIPQGSCQQKGHGPQSEVQFYLCEG